MKKLEKDVISKLLEAMDTYKSIAEKLIDKLITETDQPEKEKIAGFVREVVDGCLACQRDDGLFHDILDDPSTFIETNAAQMLSYAIYRGVAAGWLPSTYRRHADRMRAAAHRQVDEFGLVQGVCAAPHFNRPGTAAEGQAFFLLMEAAYREGVTHREGVRS